MAGPPGLGTGGPVQENDFPKRIPWNNLRDRQYDRPPGPFTGFPPSPTPPGGKIVTGRVTPCAR